MLGHRQLELDDYFAILRRRVWWIVVPAVVVPILTYLVSLKLPNRYRSQTVVLIVQQKVPDNYVKSVIGEDLNARLATMQEQILSRSRLQPIIERFRLYQQPVMTMEDRLDQMRKSITVAPIRSEYLSRSGGMPGFSISFSGDNPRIAQQVCSEITSMFMAENLRAREQAAQGTTDFLKDQLDDAKRNLDEQDRKLAAFKQQHIGQLPGQEQTNLSMLNTLNNQLDAVNQSLARAQQDRTYAESMLNQQLATLQASRSSSDPNDLRQQLSTLQAKLTDLQVRYTDDHPDVIKTKAAITEVRRKLDETDALAANASEKSSKSMASEPTAIQQLRLNIHNVQQNIRELTARQDELQKQIRTYQARVQLSPVVEEQFKAVTRDYETAQKFYDDLLAKKTQSEMATDLERRQQGEQFSILDPANLPEEPSFPNRPLFALGGLGGGFALGLVFAFVLELRDKSLRSERDIEFYLEAPTLAMIPVVGPDSKLTPGKHGGRWLRRKHRKRVHATLAMQGDHV